MIAIDLLYVMLVLELVVILGAAMVFLKIRNYRLKEKLSLQYNDLGDYLRKNIEALEEKTGHASNNSATVSTKTDTAPYETVMLHIYKIALDVIEKHPDEETPFSIKEMSGQFEKKIEQNAKILEKIGSYVIEDDSSSLEDAGQAALPAKVKATVNELKKQNIVLIGYKDTVSGVIKKFKMVLEFNKRLQSNFKEFSEMYDGLERIYTDFDSNNAELDMCVEILEKENEYLDEKVKSFKSTFSL